MNDEPTITMTLRRTMNVGPYEQQEFICKVERVPMSINDSGLSVLTETIDGIYNRLTVDLKDKVKAAKQLAKEVEQELI